MKTSKLPFIVHLIFTRMEFISKKGRIGGDKRKMTFLKGGNDIAVVAVSGIINKDATVTIADGLPTDTSRWWVWLKLLLSNLRT